MAAARRFRRRKKARGNKKIKNATPTTYDGIPFRSKMEVTTYKLLKEAGIPCEYEKKIFILVPAFTYKGQKFRTNTMKPDFTGPNYILEVKGYPSDAFPLRWKLLHKALATNPEYGYPDVYLCRNKGQTEQAIEQIRKNLNKDDRRKQVPPPANSLGDS